MKIVAFVPVKLNNERCPGKNTRQLGGIPLITRIFNTLQKVNGIDESYCFCSQEEVEQYLPSNIKRLERSEELDKSNTGILEVFKSFADKIDSDYYICAHATAPFISSESIQKGIDAVLSGEYDSAFSVTENREFLWQGIKPYLMPNYNPSDIPRTQDMTPFYIETCAFFIYKKEHILNLNKRVGNNPFLVSVSKFEAIDIDYPEDFLIAEAIEKVITK
ncbi:MAG: acylneuraminate cytidylyltransferase family protein [Oscillospiraceae bacterium]|jgi:CMP-N-acetylneuraminic acid synthetase|nr:acylneuraminate cytidylyltransferase family protein [Oscillospiraceae bacterium]